jgi:PAS domain S-box-containing protein/putative nucleotidyltransferase with HDIG domain
MEPMRITLKMKISLIVMGFFVVAFGVNTVTSNYIFKREYSEALISKGVLVGQMLKAELVRVLKYGINWNDLVGFEEQCQAAVLKYQVAFAAVVDGNGKIIFHNVQAQRGQQLHDPRILKAVRTAAGIEKVVLDSGRAMYHIILPVMEMDQATSLVIIVGLPFKAIVKKSNGLVVSSAWMALFSFTLITYLFFIISSYYFREAILKQNQLLEQQVAERTLQLRKINESLERDITKRRLTEAELAKRAEKLAGSNTELKQFAYVTSHDLKEPLRMISSYLQLLSRRYRSKLDDKAMAYLETAVDGASRMHRLIDDILDLSRVGTNDFEFQPVDCRQVVAQVAANLEVMIQESGVKVIWGDLPTVYADFSQLTRLFQNLTVNAIKFRGKPQPEIVVTAQRIVGAWRFAVRDNGIGIEPLYLERIFLIFQRLHTRSEYSGTGIGLAICKKIVERHGGKIWAESQPGAGSVFYFTIPDQGSSILKNNNGMAKMDPQQYQILLIEDNPGDAGLIAAYLEEAKGAVFRLKVAERLGSGMKRLEDGWTDLVLLDLHLPDSTGFDTFTQLYLRFPQVPIIILSGNNEESLALAAVSQGAQDYLEKGLYDGGLLVRAIRYAIERKRAEEKLRTQQEFLRNVIDTDPNMIYVTDAWGRFTLVNKVTAEYYGLTVEEMTGKILPEVLADLGGLAQVPVKGQTGLENFVTKETVQKSRDVNGQTHWWQTVQTPIQSPYGKSHQLMSIANNITERKNAEAQLLQSVERLNQLFESTVESMALTVEIRDPYTAGHQRRVAQLAKAIAETMGLADDRVAGIRLASIIHDIGKIGVPAEILSKPGRISALEFELIKTHSQVGYEVLKSIEFAWPIAEIVLQHHEQIDGTGYPRRLNGDQILLEAKILNVADVVEAMSTHRPYRPALGIARALETIVAQKGKLYDQTVVEVCLSLFQERQFAFDDDGRLNRST